VAVNSLGITAPMRSVIAAVCYCIALRFFSFEGHKNTLWCFSFLCYRQPGKDKKDKAVWLPGCYSAIGPWSLAAV
jgi:hypothetical protein